jgi:hypothetical protein
MAYCLKAGGYKLYCFNDLLLFLLSKACSSATKDVVMLSKGTLNSLATRLNTDIETPTAASSTDPINYRSKINSITDNHIALYLHQTEIARRITNPNVQQRRYQQAMQEGPQREQAQRAARCSVSQG